MEHCAGAEGMTKKVDDSMCPLITEQDEPDRRDYMNRRGTANYYAVYAYHREYTSHTYVTTGLQHSAM